MSETTQSETTNRSMHPRQVTTPRVDVYESEDGYILTADVPGANREDLALSFNGKELVLEADAGGTFRFYRRVFALPDGIDGASIAAELKDGVLNVHMSKLPEVKPRRIDVR